MKICSKCGETKPLTGFHSRAAVKDGHNSWCKTCAANWTRAHRSKTYDQERLKRRKAIITALKQHPCLDCKTVYPPECMDFDHVRGEKVLPVSTMLRSASLEAIMQEVAKCELVCSNCHRIRTEKRRRERLS